MNNNLYFTQPTLLKTEIHLNYALEVQSVILSSQLIIAIHKKISMCIVKNLLVFV